MKKIKYWISIVLLSLLTLLLCSCFTTPAQMPMSPVNYSQGQFDFHINKKATLLWKTGDVIAADGGHVVPVGGLLEGIILMTIDSIETTTDPSRFRYAYGKAQQAVFLTSLRANLEKNNVFTNVNLATDESDVPKERVKLIVEFIKTRVGWPAESYPIYLTVNLIIKDKKNTYARKIFVYSAGAANYRYHLADVSQQLMVAIIKAIKKWNSNN